MRRLQRRLVPWGKGRTSGYGCLQRRLLPWGERPCNRFKCQAPSCRRGDVKVERYSPALSLHSRRHLKELLSSPRPEPGSPRRPSGSHLSLGVFFSLLGRPAPLIAPIIRANGTAAEEGTGRCGGRTGAAPEGSYICSAGMIDRPLPTLCFCIGSGLGIRPHIARLPERNSGGINVSNCGYSRRRARDRAHFAGLDLAIQVRNVHAQSTPDHFLVHFVHDLRLSIDCPKPFVKVSFFFLVPFLRLF